MYRMHHEIAKKRLAAAKPRLLQGGAFLRFE